MTSQMSHRPRGFPSHLRHDLSIQIGHRVPHLRLYDINHGLN